MKKKLLPLFIALGLMLIPDNKQASLFAVDVGVPVVSNEKDIKAETVNIAGNMDYTGKPDGTSGYFVRAKFFGLVGLGYMDYQVKYKYDENQKYKLDSKFFELVGHVPIPITALTLSGHYGVGTRKFDSESRLLSSYNEADVSETINVTKIGIDVGLEYSFIFAVRASIGFNQIIGEKKTVTLLDNEFYVFKAEIDPNATILTLAVGAGF